MNVYSSVMANHHTCEGNSVEGRGIANPAKNLDLYCSFTMQSLLAKPPPLSDCPLPRIVFITTYTFYIHPQCHGCLAISYAHGGFSFRNSLSILTAVVLERFALLPLPILYLHLLPSTRWSWTTYRNGVSRPTATSAVSFQPCQTYSQAAWGL